MTDETSPLFGKTEFELRQALSFWRGRYTEIPCPDAHRIVDNMEAIAAELRRRNLPL